MNISRHSADLDDIQSDVESNYIPKYIFQADFLK